jgi:trans-aconitate methyltransferase
MLACLSPVAPDVPERIQWAVDALTGPPPRRILEVGCASGHALPLLRDRFPRAAIVGIDRSATQVVKARRRLEAVAPASRPTVAQLSLAAAAVRWAATPFDLALAINVNAFWTEPASAFPAVAALLQPRGALVLVYEPPTPAGCASVAARAGAAAAKAGWRVVKPPVVQGSRVLLRLEPEESARTPGPA